VRDFQCRPLDQKKVVDACRMELELTALSTKNFCNVRNRYFRPKAERQHLAQDTDMPALGCLGCFQECADRLPQLHGTAVQILRDGCDGRCSFIGSQKRYADLCDETV
jgi:hypothetical protein